MTLAEEVVALVRRPDSLSRVVAMGELVGYSRSVVTLYRNGPTIVTPMQVAPAPTETAPTGTRPTGTGPTGVTVTGTRPIPVQSPTKSPPAPREVERFPRIATLRVINRLSRRTFRGMAPQNYTGFGRLVIIGRQAFFLSAGS